jgi:minor extracellular serine protease Vpr
MLVAAQAASAAALPTTPPRIDPARVELVVGLSDPSLAQFARSQPSLQGFASRGRRVSATAFGSRLYLARLARQQAQVAARIEQAIPAARVTWHYQFVLNAMAIDLPTKDAARLAAVPGVRRVYPSIHYHALTDTVPGLIQASSLWGAPPDLPAAGQGIKIGIVDDGIDQTNPFFNPAGFAPPAGFPRGQLRYTTAKVIVARSYPPKNAPAGAKLPFDPKYSEHATHVAGIAAGDYGTVASPGGPFPTVSNLSGVAPRAYLGNYRALTLNDPLFGAGGGTPEIAAAVDAAAKDGMDVINLSLGGPETDPRADALVTALEDAVGAGIVVTVSAGNSFEELGGGSVGSPGTAPDVITVAAATTTRFFGVRAAVLGPGAVPAPLQSFDATSTNLLRIPASFAAPHDLVDATKVLKGNGDLCGKVSGSALKGRLVLVDPSARCGLDTQATRAKGAGAAGLVFRPNVPGDPSIIPDKLDVPVVMVTESVGDQLRSFAAGAGGKAQVVVQSTVSELPTTPRVIADFSSSGPTPYTHLLKPDVSAPGVSILSSVPNAAKDFPGPFAVFDGTSMAAPAVAGSAALLRQLHPTWTPGDIKSALMSTAGPDFPDSSQASEANVLREGAGFINVAAANDAAVITAPTSLAFGLIDGARGTSQTPTIAVRDLGAGGQWQVGTAIQAGAPPGVTLVAQPVLDVPLNGVVGLPVTLNVPPGAAAGEVTGFVTLTQGTRQRRIPVWALVERPALPQTAVRTLTKPGVYAGNNRKGQAAVDVYRYPEDASGSGLPKRYAGPEQLWHFHLGKRVINAGVTVEAAGKTTVLPVMLAQRDENTVAGEAGLPLDVGPMGYTAGLPEPAAGSWFMEPGDYYVSVDSPKGSDAGAYKLRYWVNDLSPPTVKLLTPELPANKPTELRFEILDAASGVDPASVLGFIGQYTFRLPYSTGSGTAVLPLPRLKPGTYETAVLAADYAQTKNSLGSRPTAANTVIKLYKFKVVAPRRGGS